MADEPLTFEGHKVASIEFELGGGGTSRETDVVLGDGDTVRGWFTGKVVNVKHSFKAAKVARVQTVNIEEGGISEILEKYVAPAEQATLEDAAEA
jgi:hypothetical protein